MHREIHEIADAACAGTGPCRKRHTEGATCSSARRKKGKQEQQQPDLLDWRGCKRFISIQAPTAPRGSCLFLVTHEGSGNNPNKLSWQPDQSSLSQITTKARRAPTCQVATWTQTALQEAELQPGAYLGESRGEKQHGNPLGSNRRKGQKKK